VQENRELALTDTLTRLPNRAKFTDELDGALRVSHRTGVPAAVLLIDLDEFKPINDRYGHETGDEVLVTFAAILRRTVRATEECARLGGDEFAVIIREVRNADAACDTARRILAALAGTPVLVGSHTLSLRASIGIALTDPTQSSVDGPTLIRRADEAMYAAKRARTVGWQLWSATATPDSEAEATISSQPVLYGPVHDLSGQLVAVHVVPGTSCDTDCTESAFGWLDEAADHLGRWRLLSPAHPDLRLCVTAGPATTESTARPNLERSGLRPVDLIIDITPLAPFTDEAALAHVQHLRDEGALTAIDTTNPGLGRIVEIFDVPIDLVLVGNCAVGGNTTSPQALALTEAAIRIGQAIGSSPHAHQPGLASSIDTYFCGDRNDASVQAHSGRSAAPPIPHQSTTKRISR
jgi:diguanylate cyclase (GGDEF)-like protein